LEREIYEKEKDKEKDTYNSYKSTRHGQKNLATSIIGMKNDVCGRKKRKRVWRDYGRMIISPRFDDNIMSYTC